MFAPARSSVLATAMNSSSLAATTLPMILLPRAPSSPASIAKCSTPRFLRFSGVSSPAMSHDLKTSAPRCTAPSSKISPRSADRAPEAFIIEEAISTPPNRIEVRSILYFLQLTAMGGQVTALFANGATANFEVRGATGAIMTEASIRRASMDAMIAHAEREFPFECCGFVMDDGDDTEEVRPIENIQNRKHGEDPAAFPRDARTAFLMEPREHLAVMNEVDRRKLGLRSV